MAGNSTLIAELDDAMASRSGQGRTDTLRKVTDLFVGNAANYSAEQVNLFDNVIGRLAEDSDVPAKAELSERLAHIENAPAQTVQQLAADDMIDVAGPVLAHSNKISETQLAQLAATKGKRHMLAIAGREALSEAVTDALLTRGDQQVARTVANNAGAQVSEKGFDALTKIAETDASFAETVVQRADIPKRHFRTLIMLAPEPVQRRLAQTNPRLAERIRQAIAEGGTNKPAQRDYTAAKETITWLAKAGGLVEERVAEFAKDGRFEETVVALAILLRMPLEITERALTSEPTDVVLIAAKSAGFAWPAARYLFLMRTAGRSSPQDIEDARLNFLRLKPETAKQGLQFYKARAGQG